jgi:hypothetical protein
LSQPFISSRVFIVWPGNRITSKFLNIGNCAQSFIVR